MTGTATKPSAVAPTYWDSSAVIATLADETRSPAALAVLQSARRVHLLSTLAWSEVLAGVSRLVREGKVTLAQRDRAADRLARAPWRSFAGQPDRQLARDLAQRHALRGPDLWHLTLALTVRQQLEELEFCCFDLALATAAAAEGLPVVAMGETS